MLFLIFEKVSLLPFHMCSCSPELVPPFAHYHLASRLHISAGFVSITMSLVQESPPVEPSWYHSDAPEICVPDACTTVIDHAAQWLLAEHAGGTTP